MDPAAPGGVNTISAETLTKGTFALTFGVDFSTFETVDDAEGLDRSAASGDHVDAIDHSFIETLALSYGVTDTFELGLAAGYYTARDARIYDAGTEDPEEEPTVKTFDPDGATDVWLHGKFRFAKSADRTSAFIGGIKAPTGKDNVTDSEGEPVEPPSRAGTGAWDADLAFAHTERISQRFRVDASARYTFHQRHEDFRIGDRVDLGVAACYRMSLKHLPRWFVIGELNARFRQHNEEGSADVPNSGGNSYFATVGVVTQLSEKMSIVLAGVAPLMEDLNGNQVETRAKLQAAVSFEF
ncbi:MAG: hypothetical protein U0166_12280 [Acidobacteriota bacterium]